VLGTSTTRSFPPSTPRHSPAQLMSSLSNGVPPRASLNSPAHLSTSALASGKSSDQETKRSVHLSSLLAAAHGSLVADSKPGGMGVQVNVFVNGRPIPFNMKIGEAGEAFFVFETDEDVPIDLMTSPILEATNPSSPKTATGDTQPEQQQLTGRFGAQKSGTTLGDQQSDANLEEERKLSGDVSSSCDIPYVLMAVH